jgi:hypothetical protein
MDSKDFPENWLISTFYFILKSKIIFSEVRLNLLTPRNENFASHLKAYLKAQLWALIKGKLENISIYLFFTDWESQFEIKDRIKGVGAFWQICTFFNFFCLDGKLLAVTLYSLLCIIWISSDLLFLLYKSSFEKTLKKTRVCYRRCLNYSKIYFLSFLLIRSPQIRSCRPSKIYTIFESKSKI